MLPKLLNSRIGCSSFVALENNTFYLSISLYLSLLKRLHRLESIENSGKKEFASSSMIDVGRATDKYVEETTNRIAKQNTPIY